jgi:hypothetical protein
MDFLDEDQIVADYLTDGAEKGLLHMERVLALLYVEDELLLDAGR